MTKRIVILCWSFILNGSNSRRASLLIGLALPLSLSLTSSVHALQSGSRGTASPSAGLSSPTFSAPTGGFSSPTFTGQPQIVTSQNFGQPATGFSPTPNQGFAPQQFSALESQSLTAAPVPSSSASSAGSSSLGIPSASIVDPVFEINDPYSAITVDHSAWNCFLSCYVRRDQQGLNRVAYRNVSGGDRQQLQSYINYLQSIDTRVLNRNEQLAYWFNLYNAKTVDVVLTNYPIRSIRQVKEKLTDFVGPFDDAGAVQVLGKSLSLNDIESGIIRPVWKDPRIHYALNCASYGCPNLASTAWTSANLEGRLNGAAFEYINSGRAVKSGLLGLRVSKIYKWYKDDFGGSDQAVIAHLRQYASPSTARQLNNAGGRIGGYFYDWSLNDARIQRVRLLERWIR